MPTQPSPTRARTLLGVCALLALCLGALVATPASAQDGGGGRPVVDEAGVLTGQQRQFLANAVEDVRDRTDFHATVIVVPRMQGRSAEAIAGPAQQRAPEGTLPVTLVLANGNPPVVNVVAPEGRVADLGIEEEITYAAFSATGAARDEGLPQAGVAFTAALVDGPPDAGSGDGASGPPTFLVLILFVILAVSAFRTVREHQRSRPVPDEATPVGSLADGVAMVHGHIVADRYLTLGHASDLVWFEFQSATSLKRATQWRNDYTGQTWTETEYAGTDTDHRQDSVEFAVQDETGLAHVNPQGANVNAPTLQKAGNVFSDHSQKLTGLRLADRVTVMGPVRRLSESEVAFAPRWRTGADVIITVRPPKKARAWLKRRLWRRYGWTTLWLVLFLLSLTIRPA